MSALTVQTPSTEEPISTVDAKDHLRISSTDEDVLIDSYVSAARNWAETFTRRAFVDTGYRYSIEDFPIGDEIELPRSPLSESTSVTVSYFPSSGGTQTLSTDAFFVDDQSEPPRVVLKSSESWPTDELRNVNGVQVDFTAGYGASTDVPHTLKHAVKMLTAHFWENREAVSQFGRRVPHKIPMAAESLLWSERVPDVP